MATIIILTPEQLAERERKPAGSTRLGRRRSPARTAIIESYKTVLQEAEPGFGGEMHLADGEDKRLVRQNLKAAANELNLALDFRPVKNPTRIYFRVITPEEYAARPRRGGRPRKNRQMEPGQAPADEQAMGEPRTQARRPSRRRQEE
jgi:hypothetical protein